MADKLGDVFVEVRATQDKYKKDLEKLEKESKESAKKSSEGFKKNAKLSFDDRIAKKKLSELQALQQKLRARFERQVNLNVSSKGLETTRKQLASVENRLKGVSKEAEHVPGKFAKIKEAAVKIGAVAAGAFAIKKVFDIGKAAIKTAMDFETLRSRLVALKGSQEEATKTFEIYKKVAATTPFDLKGLTAAGATLEAFGIDSQKQLKTTADLAAYMGTSAEEAAAAWGRAWAGGAGAADIFRERGVLNMIQMQTGIEDLTKLTKDEFRTAMLDTFTDVERGIAGATDIISKTAAGGISNLQDSLDAFADAVFSGTMPAINSMARGLAGIVSSITPVETELEKVNKKGYEQRTAFEALVLSYDSLRKNTSRTKDEQAEYQRVIGELQSKYPQYLGNLDLEKDGYDKVTAAIDETREAMKNRLKIQGIAAGAKDLENEIEGLYEKQGVALNEQYKAKAGLLALGIESERFSISELKRAGLSNKEIDKAQKLAAVLATQKRRQEKITKELSDAEKELSGYMEANGKVVKKVREEEELITAQKRAQELAAKLKGDQYKADLEDAKKWFEGQKETSGESVALWNEYYDKLFKISQNKPIPVDADTKPAIKKLDDYKKEYFKFKKTIGEGEKSFTFTEYRKVSDIEEEQRTRFSISSEDPGLIRGIDEVRDKVKNIEPIELPAVIGGEDGFGDQSLVDQLQGGTAIFAEELEKRLQVAQEFAQNYSSLMGTIVDGQIKKLQQQTNKEIDFTKKSYNEKIATTDALIKAREKEGKNNEKLIAARAALEEEAEDKITAIKEKAAEKEKKIKNKMKTASIAEAVVNTAVGVTSALKGMYPLNLINAAIVAAAGAVQVATIRAQKFAKGGDFVTNGPQMIMVGDNPGGKERVQVTPLSSPNFGGPGGLTINFAPSVNALDGQSAARWFKFEGRQAIMDLMKDVSARK